VHSDGVRRCALTASGGMAATAPRVGVTSTAVAKRRIDAARTLAAPAAVSDVRVEVDDGSRTP